MSRAERSPEIRRFEEQCRGRRFHVFSHGQMLGDRRRLDAYRRAIAERVGPDDEVVEIGTGTGILTSYLAEATRRPVIGIELEAEAARLGEKILRAGGADVRLYNGVSFGQPVDAAPDALVSEILGGLGVDENVVEVYHEFVRSYPSIRTLVPSAITLFAVPIRSASLEAECARVLASYREASHGPFDFGLILPEVERELCSAMIQREPRDVEIAGDPVEVAHFVLGEARTSDFDRVVDLPAARADFTFLRLYFEARLSPSVVLSNAGDATHWERCFLRRWGSSRRARLTYSRSRRELRAAWED